MISERYDVMYYNTVNIVIAIIVDAKTPSWRLRLMMTT